VINAALTGQHILGGELEGGPWRDPQKLSVSVDFYCWKSNTNNEDGQAPSNLARGKSVQNDIKGEQRR
jgi:hypothetical protein